MQRIHQIRFFSKRTVKVTTFINHETRYTLRKSFIRFNGHFGSFLTSMIGTLKPVQKRRNDISVLRINVKFRVQLCQPSYNKPLKPTLFSYSPLNEVLKNFFCQQYKEKVIFQSLQRKRVKSRLPLNIVTITRQIRHGLFVQRLRRNVSCLLQGKHRLHWIHILSKH